MEPTFTLYECPPLRARITSRQCAANRARANGEKDTRARSPRGSLTLDWPPGRQECAGCAGVEAWANRVGCGPTTVSATELIDQLRRNEAQRRLLSGPPPETERHQAPRTRRYGFRSAGAGLLG